jgi:SMC interacting uncharacterized protein involved in chromosome segregation
VLNNDQHAMKQKSLRLNDEISKVQRMMERKELELKELHDSRNAAQSSAHKQIRSHENSLKRVESQISCKRLEKEELERKLEALIREYKILDEVYVLNKLCNSFLTSVVIE